MRLHSFTMSVDLDNTQDSQEDSRNDGGDTHTCPQDTESSTDDTLEAILRDPRRKAALMQRIGLEDSRSDGQATDDGHLTPSGMATGGWGYPPAPIWGFAPPPWRHMGIPCFPTGDTQNRDRQLRPGRARIRTRRVFECRRQICGTRRCPTVHAL